MKLFGYCLVLTIVSVVIGAGWLGDPPALWASAGLLGLIFVGLVWGMLWLGRGVVRYLRS